VEFSPDAVPQFGGGAGSLLLWRANPLLNPFVASEIQVGYGRFQVPECERDTWAQRLCALDREMTERREGYWHAVAGLLVLLLVDVARLAQDVTGQLRERHEPLLADVFGIIEERFAQKLTLPMVAGELGFSPGYLTTIVRARTGRTVHEWISERRMAEARNMLLATTLTVEAIAAAVGFADPAYFSRRFRSIHRLSPGAWRAAAPG
jgi:AraC-like DNA-binding protein